MILPPSLTIVIAPTLNILSLKREGVTVDNELTITYTDTQLSERNSPVWKGLESRCFYCSGLLKVSDIARVLVTAGLLFLWTDNSVTEVRSPHTAVQCQIQLHLLHSS